MRKNRFTIDELLEELRCQGYSGIDAVKFAVLENSGQLSILPWTAEQPPTARQLGLSLADETTLPTVLINDGRVLTKNLRLRGRDEAWLKKTLREQGFQRPEEVFLLTFAPESGVFCLGKEDAT